MNLCRRAGSTLRLVPHKSGLPDGARWSSRINAANDVHGPRFASRKLPTVQ